MRQIASSKILLAANVGVLMLLGACEKKAGGEVVAVVNGQAITQEELNAELGNTQIPPSDRKQVMTQLLQRVIDRRLVISRAIAEGLDQVPPYLTRVRRAQDEILVSMLAQKFARSEPLPEPRAADKFILENPTLFAGRKRYALDQIIFPANNGSALAAKLRAAHTMEEVKEALESFGVRFSRGSNALDTANIPGELGAQLAELPPGEPFLVLQGRKYVVSVIRSAQDAPTSVALSKPIATEVLRRQAVSKAMIKMIAEERAKAKIGYQPGFAPANVKGAASVTL